MKKILLLLVLSIMAVLGWGQSPDTVYNRSNELYYSEWYDTCAYFYSFPAYSRYSYCLFTRTSHEEDTSFHFYNFHIVPDYVSRPLKVRGLAAMVTMTWDMCGWRRFFWRSPTRLPEYLYLYQKVGDKLVKLKEVRWDTATPQIYKLPCNHDTATWGFDSCYLYRVYFDTAVTVDSVFYIGGSFFNNLMPDDLAYLHVPTFYVGMTSPDSPRPRYHNKNLFGLNTSGRDIWFPEEMFNDLWGPFFAIAPDTSVLLDVRTSDSTMGQVDGGGWYLDSSLMTIQAIPSRHYHFTHWDDGDTSNPRMVLLTKDTMFTAYFQEDERYEINALATPIEAGLVEGAGVYYAGDTVVLSAVAREGYVFDRWNLPSWHEPVRVTANEGYVFDRRNDSIYQNPLSLVASQNGTYMANFSRVQSIEECDSEGVAFTIMPNPARGRVTLLLPEGKLGKGVLLLRDESGKELRRLKTDGGQLTLSIGDLAAGAYYVTLETAQGTATRKLMVE